MPNKIFTNDVVVEKELVITQGKPIEKVAKTITADVSKEAVLKGDAFAK